MARILVFDSGVGGLSILRAIQSHPDIDITQHQWLFCSDNAFFPYGTKPEDILIQRVCAVLSALYDKFQPDIIVIACNTASTIALEAVRQKLPCAIVGVVPAIKPAAQLSVSKSIGLLATPGTIARRYTQQLIEDFASDCKVTAVGSSELVQMAESYLRTGVIDKQSLAHIVEPFYAEQRISQLDTMVLACTHFPLIGDALKEICPAIKHWVDSGDAIARRVLWLLNQQEIERTDHGSNCALFTRNAGSDALDPHESVDELLRNTFKSFGLSEFEYIDI